MLQGLSPATFVRDYQANISVPIVLSSLSFPSQVNLQISCMAIYKSPPKSRPFAYGEMVRRKLTNLYHLRRRRQWHPTPVLLPGNSHGRRSLVGCMGSLRVGHDGATSLSLSTFMHWRRKWQPTPVFLPGESQGQESLVGCRLWGHTESDMTEATQQLSNSDLGSKCSTRDSSHFRWVGSAAGLRPMRLTRAQFREGHLSSGLSTLTSMVIVFYFNF